MNEVLKQLHDQEAAERKRLQGALDYLSQLDPSKLVRTAELGTQLDFSHGVETFRRALGLFDQLRSLSLDGYPASDLKKLADVATEMVNRFQAVENFSVSTVPGGENPEQHRDNLVSNIANYYGNAFSVVSPAVAYGMQRGRDFDALGSQAKNLVEEIASAKAAAEAQGAEFTTEAERVLQSVRETAGKLGVAKHAEHFADEANAQMEESKKWLKWTVILAIATALVAVGALSSWLIWRPSFDSAEAVQIAIAKVALFSVLYVGLVWSGRNYSSHRHNYTVNKHRQNSLRTFEAFVEAASDEPTKNAVLLQATQAIFSPQTTGYIQADGGDGYRMPQVLEIIRGTTGKQPS